MAALGPLYGQLLVASNELDNMEYKFFDGQLLVTSGELDATGYKFLDAFKFLCTLPGHLPHVPEGVNPDPEILRWIQAKQEFIELAPHFIPGQKFIALYSTADVKLIRRLAEITPNVDFFCCCCAEEE